MNRYMGRGEDILRDFYQSNSTDTVMMFRDSTDSPYRPVTIYDVETKIGLEGVYENGVLYFTQHSIIGVIEDKNYVIAQGDNFRTDVYLNFPVPVCLSVAKTIGTINDFTSYSPELDEKTGKYIVHIRNMFIMSEPGNYFLNLNCDSGNAGYPFLTSKRIQVVAKEGIDLTKFNVIIADMDNTLEASLKAKFIDAFNATYRTMYEHFDIDGATPKSIGIKFSASYYAPASMSGANVWYNSHWARNCPHDIDALTHELAHIIQHHDGALPDWFVEGFADYCRYIYGIHPEGDTWLPAKWYPNQYYKPLYDGKNNCCKHQDNSRFLVWLNENYGAPKNTDLVYEIHKMIKQGIYSQPEWDDEKMFDSLIGKSLDELWHEYSNSDYELDYKENYKRILGKLAPERLSEHKF